MFGPGEYVPDETLGVANVEDLPKPKMYMIAWKLQLVVCTLVLAAECNPEPIGPLIDDIGIYNRTVSP